MIARTRVRIGADYQIQERCKVLYTDNHGSTTVEITLLMPVLLLSTCLMLTMLLSVLHQAGLHAKLVVHSMEQQLQEEDSHNTVAFVGDQDRTEQSAAYHVRKDGDLLIYSESSSIHLVSGYEIDESVEQRVRIVDEEQRIRRWQMLGGVLSE